MGNFILNFIHTMKIFITFRYTFSSERKKDVKLSRKDDLIIWLYLSDIQLQIYEEFLKTASVREVLSSIDSLYAALLLYLFQ